MLKKNLNQLPRGKPTRYLKENNLIHFDVEPFNILRTGSGNKTLNEGFKKYRLLNLPPNLSILFDETRLNHDHYLHQNTHKTKLDL